MINYNNIFNKILNEYKNSCDINLSNNDKNLLKKLKTKNISLPFYHLSKNDKIKYLSPKYVRNKYIESGVEEQTIARSSVSTSIDGCLIGLGASAEINVTLAVSEIKRRGGNPNEEVFFNNPKEIKKFFNGRDTIFNVYILPKNTEVYKPSIKEVPDVKVTDEYWVVSPVKVKRIGKIQVIGVIPNKLDKNFQYNVSIKNNDIYNLNGVHQVFLPKWKWIEKL